jgi:hypothetical protein
MEAEMIAVVSGARELVWLQYLLLDLGHSLSFPSPLFLDDSVALDFAESHVITDASKHIGVRFLFLKEQVAAGVISVSAVPSAHQLVDLLTKPLPLPVLSSQYLSLGLFTDP